MNAVESSSYSISGHVSTAPSRNPTLAGLSLAMLIASFGASIANVALPAITSAFDITLPRARWIVLAYLLGSTTVVVGAGRIGDVFGRRRLLLTGLLLFAAASLAGGIAGSLWVLIAARAVQGIAAAALMATSLALAGETVPRDRIGSAMGLLGTTSAAGTALGPTLAGVLIAGEGWRAIMLVNVPLALAAWAIVRRTLPVDRPGVDAGKPDFDIHGTVLLGLTLGAYALSMTVGRGSVGLLNTALLAAAVAGAGLFVLVETRSDSPLIQLAMFRDPVLRAGLTMSALVSTVMMATLVVGPFYLSRSLGLGPASVGMVMSIGPLFVAFGGVPAGRIVDRWGAGRMTMLGLLAIGVGTTMLAAFPAGVGLIGYVLPIIVITLGYASFQAANNTAVMREAGQERRGVVSGMLSLSRNLGLITGASAMAAVFTFAADTSDIVLATPRDVTTGMRFTFAVAALLALAALCIAIKQAVNSRDRRAELTSSSEQTYPSSELPTALAPEPSVTQKRLA